MDQSHRTNPPGFVKKEGKEEHFNSRKKEPFWYQTATVGFGTGPQEPTAAVGRYWNREWSTSSWF